MPNIVRVKIQKIKMIGHIARMEEGRSAFKIVTGKPTGKRQLESPSRRWDENNRINLKEIGINTRNWVDSTQDRDYWRTLVNAEMNFRAS